MTDDLKWLMDSKSHLVSFRQHGHKFRCLVGEKACTRRIAFERYRVDLRYKVFFAHLFVPPPASPEEEAAQKDKERRAAAAKKTSPIVQPPPRLVPAGVLPQPMQPSSPLRYRTNGAAPLTPPHRINQMPAATTFLQPASLMDERMVQESVESTETAVAQSPVVLSIMAAAAAAVIAMQWPPPIQTQLPSTDILMSPMHSSAAHVSQDVTRVRAAAPQLADEIARKPAAAIEHSRIGEDVAVQQIVRGHSDRSSRGGTAIDDFGNGHDGASSGLTTNEAESSQTMVRLLLFHLPIQMESLMHSLPPEDTSQPFALTSFSATRCDERLIFFCISPNGKRGMSRIIVVDRYY
jgi:hypothetical protein